MQIDADRAAAVFRKINTVRDDIRAYSIDGDSHVLPIEGFQRVVETMCKIQVKKRLVSFRADHLRGMVERFDTVAFVYVRKGLPENDIRFSAVKELCHLVLDEPEDWSPEGVTTIREFLSDTALGLREGHQALAAALSQSEQLAEVAAVELMYPFALRRKNLADLDAERTTVAQLAAHYRVPEFVVTRAHWPRYHEVISEMWDEVGGPTYPEVSRAAE